MVSLARTKIGYLSFSHPMCIACFKEIPCFLCKYINFGAQVIPIYLDLTLGHGLAFDSVWELTHPANSMEWNKQLFLFMADSAFLQFIGKEEWG